MPLMNKINVIGIFSFQLTSSFKSIYHLPMTILYWNINYNFFTRIITIFYIFFTHCQNYAKIVNLQTQIEVTLFHQLNTEIMLLMSSKTKCYSEFDCHIISEYTFLQITIYIIFQMFIYNILCKIEWHTKKLKYFFSI